MVEGVHHHVEVSIQELGIFKKYTKLQGIMMKFFDQLSNDKARF